MTRHRGAPVRPRYGRLAALGSSLSITTIAVLGGLGVLPSAAGGPEHASREGTDAAAIGTVADARPRTDGATGTTPDGSTGTPDGSTGTSGALPGASAPTDDPAADTALPPGSGTGRRIVFSQGRQRVWLVPGGQRVARTYLVSGSLTDNLDPGTYAVYSRSEQAIGIDDSGTMKYFVRFTQGDTGAAIGFHDIPINHGEPVQSLAELGTPQSHGCIRQKRADAIALWQFAPIGTKVVVTA